MPTIPDFEVNVPVAQPGQAPHADPGAFAAPGAALEQVGNTVQNVADQYAARYAAARQQMAASSAIADGTKQMNDLSFTLSKQPDSAAAYTSFNQQADQIRQKLLGTINDPEVAAHVGDQLQHYQIIQANTTRHAAFGVESSANIARIQGTELPGYANTIATSTEPLARAYAVDQINSSLTGAAQAAWITPEQALAMKSKAMRDAVETRAASDPIGAQALLKELSTNMTEPDIAGSTQLLKNAVPRRQAEDAAMSFSLSPPGSGGTGVEAVRQGFLKRGYDPDFAVAMAAQASAESTGRPDAVNPDGSSRGLFQLTGARLVAFRASHGGLNPEQTSLDDQLDYADYELKGPESAARQQIEAAQGVNAKGQAASKFFERPGLTPEIQQAEAVKRGAIADTIANGGQANIADQLTALRQKVSGLEPRFQDYAESMLLKRWHDQQAVTAGQRGELGRNLSNLEANYLQGNTGTEPPEDQIRSLLPPDRADEEMAKLTIARSAGDLFSGVAYASPEQERDAMQALSVPGSLASGRVTIRDHQVVAPPGGIDDGSGSPEQAETADNMALRTRVQQQYQRLLDAKHRALATDPAGYAATQPDTAAALRNADPNDPASMQGALQRMMDTQRSLGVPENNVRVLTNSQVASTVQQLTSGDPATRNIPGLLDGLKQQYGPLYPQVFHELVNNGKLSPDWQVVGAMTEPSQMGARQDLVRVLQQAAKVSAGGGGEGIDKLGTMISKTDKTDIDNNLVADLQPFRQTIAIPGNSDNAPLMGAVQEAVRGLAYSYVMKGMPSSEARTAAVNAVIGNKYQMDGMLRTPTGMMSDVQSSGATMQRNLTTADLAPPSTPDRTLSDEQNRQVILNSAQRNGQWVTNSRDDGAVLMTRLRDGSFVPVIGRNGPIGFKWSDVRGSAAATPGSATPAPGSVQTQPAAASEPINVTSAPVLP